MPFFSRTTELQFYVIQTDPESQNNFRKSMFYRPWRWSLSGVFLRNDILQAKMFFFSYFIPYLAIPASPGECCKKINISNSFLKNLKVFILEKKLCITLEILKCFKNVITYHILNCHENVIDFTNVHYCYLY